MFYFLVFFKTDFNKSKAEGKVKSSPETSPA